MAQLSDRIEIALSEARMLLLGGQVLLGFGYRIFFEEAFEQLPNPARLAQLSAIGILTAGLGWLIWPAAFHQIAERGAETEAVHRFTTFILDWALLPLAVGLGLSFYPAYAAMGLPHAPWSAVAVTGFALAVWYGMTLKRFGANREQRASQPAPPDQGEASRKSGPDLSERIKEVLIECRMALPGAQAFLGFQFSIVFMRGFEQLPRSSRLIHLASLIATTVCIVLLIAPAAYHRMVERGRETERFHKVASRLMLAALVFLAPGVAGDFLVVTRKITGSDALSTWISLGLLLLFYGLWFGVSIWKRRVR